MALQEHFATIAEASGELHVSAESVRRLIVAGDLAAERAGGWTWLISRDSLDRLVSERRAGGR